MGISVLLDAVTAGAAVAVAVIANRYSKRQTTLQLLRDFGDRLSALNAQYRAHGMRTAITQSQAVQIQGNAQLFDIVVAILDEYESLSLAIVEQIADPRIAKRLIGPTVLSGYEHFEKMITHVRQNQGNKQAWSDFEQVAKSWR